MIKENACDRILCEKRAEYLIIYSMISTCKTPSEENTVIRFSKDANLCYLWKVGLWGMSPLVSFHPP